MTALPELSDGQAAIGLERSTCFGQFAPPTFRPCIFSVVSPGCLQPPRHHPGNNRCSNLFVCITNHDAQDVTAVRPD